MGGGVDRMAESENRQLHGGQGRAGEVGTEEEE
jgi:hypothetical protein